MAIVKKSYDGKKNDATGGLLRFTQWKQIAIEEMLKDNELMKLLIYNVNNWHEKRNPTDEQKFGLIGNQIFKYSLVDQIAKDKKSYIGISLSHFTKDEGFRRFSNRYVMGYLYFHILVDLGIMETDLGVRSDLILGRIYEIFQDNDTMGMGEMKVETAIERWVDSGSHGGYVVGFRLTELE